jgi:hypothetical protein
MRKLGYLTILFFVFLSCLEKKQNLPKSCLLVNDQDEEQFYWFDEVSKDVYNFFTNRKLQYYVFRKNGEMQGEAIYFYENGSVELIANFNEGNKHGIENRFYPSGNLKKVSHFYNDSLRGYFIEYYDRFNTKKAEYMASPNEKSSYIYKRSYDSATQQVIEVLDHRFLELEENPNTDPKALKMPWEDENWYK